MHCYRDMTFCSFYLTCEKAANCNRKLTPEVESIALSRNDPICQFVEKPECYREKINSGMLLFAAFWEAGK